MNSNKKIKPWFVYILRCKDGTLYTGITTNIKRRIKEHNGSKRGAKYTRSRRPVKLEAQWVYESRSAALREEARIKKLNRSDKIMLIRERKREKY